MFECRVSGQVWFYRVWVIPPRVSGFQVPDFITNSKSEIFNVFWKSHPEAPRRNYRHLVVLFFFIYSFLHNKIITFGIYSTFWQYWKYFLFCFLSITIKNVYHAFVFLIYQLLGYYLGKIQLKSLYHILQNYNQAADK